MEDISKKFVSPQGWAMLSKRGTKANNRAIWDKDGSDTLLFVREDPIRSIPLLRTIMSICWYCMVRKTASGLDRWRRNDEIEWRVATLHNIILCMPPALSSLHKELIPQAPGRAKYQCIIEVFYAYSECKNKDWRKLTTTRGRKFPRRLASKKKDNFLNRHQPARLCCWVKRKLVFHLASRPHTILCCSHYQWRKITHAAFLPNTNIVCCKTMRKIANKRLGWADYEREPFILWNRILRNR